MAKVTGEAAREPRANAGQRRLSLVPLLLIPLALVATMLGTTPRAPEVSAPPAVRTPTLQADGGGSGVATVGGADFIITGDVANLMPGTAADIRLTLTNPHTAPLVVTDVHVSVSPDSAPPGCISADNVSITQSDVSRADPITIPASGSVTLSTAPRAPQIEFLDLPDVNQDECQHRSFALTYTGTASH